MRVPTNDEKIWEKLREFSDLKENLVPMFKMHNERMDRIEARVRVVEKSSSTSNVDMLVRINIESLTKRMVELERAVLPYKHINLPYKHIDHQPAVRLAQQLITAITHILDASPGFVTDQARLSEIRKALAWAEGQMEKKP